MHEGTYEKTTKARVQDRIFLFYAVAGNDRQVNEASTNTF